MKSIIFSLIALLFTFVSGCAEVQKTTSNGYTREDVIKILESSTWARPSDNSYYLSGYENVSEYLNPSIQAPSPAPFKPEYQAEYDYVRKAASEGRNLVDFKADCYRVGIPFGVPHSLPYGNKNFIFTDDGRLYIEMGSGAREFRKIWLDGRPLPAEVFEPQRQGYSAGHWDGSSFVIETIGIRNDVQAEDGMVLSEELRVIERFTLENDKRLRLDATLIDPVKFYEPWKPIPIYYEPLDKPDVETQWLTFMDNECAENRAPYVDGQTRMLDDEGRDLGSVLIEPDEIE